MKYETYIVKLKLRTQEHQEYKQFTFVLFTWKKKNLQPVVSYKNIFKIITGVSVVQYFNNISLYAYRLRYWHKEGHEES